MPDLSIYKSALGNYRRRNHHPNLTDGATVILLGGKKLVGLFLRDVRYIGDGYWTGQRMTAFTRYKWCSKEVLEHEPRGSEVRFRSEGVWLAYRLEAMNAETPADCTAVTQGA